MAEIEEKVFADRVLGKLFGFLQCRVDFYVESTSVALRARKNFLVFGCVKNAGIRNFKRLSPTGIAAEFVRNLNRPYCRRSFQTSALGAESTPD